MKRIRSSLSKSVIVPLMALALVGGTIGTASTVAAQEQDPQPPSPDGNPADMPFSDFDIALDGPGIGGRGGVGGGFANVCSTVTDTDVVAKALGITAAELRLALVSGKTIAELAASKSIDVTTIQTALDAQRQADLEQAVKDGLITQAQLDAYNTAKANNPAQGANIRFQIRVSAMNTVNRTDVAAKAIGITCAELVKAQQAGKSIAQVAQEKNANVQTVIDAVVNAIKAAAAKDVTEGLITQAQADARTLRVTNAVGQWVYSVGRGGRNGGAPGFGGRGNDGRGGGNPGGPNRPGKGGAQPTPPAQPTAPAPSATPTT